MLREPAVFLDKDGTLVENIPYNVDPARIRLAPGAAEWLPRLQLAGYRLFVVSNQSGVARGYFREEALWLVAQRLRDLVAQTGASLAGFYYCPHHPCGDIPAYAMACDCRKPAHGMFLRAAEEHAIDLHHSWLVGDILDDVEAGKRAGCHTVLIANGNETEWRQGPERRPDRIARDFSQAARWIVSSGSPPPLAKSGGRHRSRLHDRTPSAYA